MSIKAIRVPINILEPTGPHHPSYTPASAPLILSCETKYGIWEMAPPQEGAVAQFHCNVGSRWQASEGSRGIPLSELFFQKRCLSNLFKESWSEIHGCHWRGGVSYAYSSPLS